MSHSFRESFSQEIPTLQIAHDSTSLGELKHCARKYKYRIIDGYVEPQVAVDLEFGQLMHSGKEDFEHARAKGETYNHAAEFAISNTLARTWNVELQRPWYTGHPNKNRETLVRSIAWYLDQFRDDTLETIILPNGRPCVEQPFRFELGYESRFTGEQYLICGRIDRGVNFQGLRWIEDTKTTRFTLNAHYFARFTPGNQISCYSVAGQHVFGTSIGGVIVHAMQILVKSTVFQRGFITRSEAQLEEWLKHTWYKIRENEKYVEDNDWPMNDMACGIPHVDAMTGEMRQGCEFREICSAEPNIREELLNAKFTKRIWDPLKLKEKEKAL